MKIIEEKPIKVFKKDKKYLMSIGNKKQDGTYENAYIGLRFNKDVELDNETMIYINNAWLSFYKWEYQDKKGTTWFIRCSDFKKVEEVIEESKHESNNMDIYEDFGNENLDDTLDEFDLPF